MKEYRFSEKNAQSSIKSQTFWLIAMSFITAISSFILVNSLIGLGIINDSLVLKVSISALLVAIVVMLVIKKATKALMQHIYRITPTGIEIAPPSGQSIIIDFDKIDAQKMVKRGLFIKSQNQKIIIPKWLDGYDEISGLILERLKSVTH